MDPLFHKAMVAGDFHFGRSGNSPQANQDNLEFLTWAIDEARTWGADQCIMLGDWHDSRHSIAVTTMLASLEGMDLLNAAFRHVWWLPGNHDLLYRERRDAASIEFARYLPNIEIVRKPLTCDNVTFLPWLLPDEHKTLDLDSRYVFAHLEMAGFLRNAKSIMPESEHTVTSQQFHRQEAVYTGHFHMRQSSKNIHYIGNVMPFNFNDDGDDQRGMMLLQWGHDPIFRAWPGQPLYRSIKLTELLDTAATVLKPNMTVRVSVDMPLAYEEAQEMREVLMASYDLRKIELCHGRADVEQDVEPVDIAFRTVDEIVSESLQHIESVGLSSQRLIEIYQSLL
jgi:DNA repair exonuclease SbcCD nuclease subunit